MGVAGSIVELSEFAKTVMEQEKPRAAESFRERGDLVCDGKGEEGVE